MMAFIHAHYALCLIGGIILGAVLGVVIAIALVYAAERAAIGRGLGW